MRAHIRASIKSQFINILRANPSLSRIYKPAEISAEANSTETINLAQRYPVFARYIPVPHHPNTKVCTHVRVTGHRCGSPALRGERFCYFHQRMMRGVPVPPDARLHPVALIENEAAIQASLMEVINAIARNTIDIRRAELILKALHIAVKNTRRTHPMTSPMTGPRSPRLSRARTAAHSSRVGSSWRNSCARRSRWPVARSWSIHADSGSTGNRRAVSHSDSRAKLGSHVERSQRPLRSQERSDEQRSGKERSDEERTANRIIRERKIRNQFCPAQTSGPRRTPRHRTQRQKKRMSQKSKDPLLAKEARNGAPALWGTRRSRC
jgi:hypothetical protein